MTSHVSDRAKRFLILGPTAALPRPSRVRVRRSLLEGLERGRTGRARLLIIGHPKSRNTSSPA